MIVLTLFIYPILDPLKIDRRGYWRSARILLENYRKYKGSKMEIFENGTWQSLTVKRAEELAKIED